MNREQREKLLKIDVKQLQDESCGLSLAVYGLLSDEQKKMQMTSRRKCKTGTICLRKNGKKPSTVISFTG